MTTAANRQQQKRSMAQPLTNQAAAWVPSPGTGLSCSPSAQHQCCPASVGPAAAAATQHPGHPYPAGHPTAAWTVLSTSVCPPQRTASTAWQAGRTPPTLHSPSSRSPQHSCSRKSIKPMQKLLHPSNLTGHARWQNPAASYCSCCRWMCHPHVAQQMPMGPRSCHQHQQQHQHSMPQLHAVQLGQHQQGVCHQQG